MDHSQTWWITCYAFSAAALDKTDSMSAVGLQIRRKANLRNDAIIIKVNSWLVRWVISSLLASRKQLHLVWTVTASAPLSIRMWFQDCCDTVLGNPIHPSLSITLWAMPFYGMMDGQMKKQTEKISILPLLLNFIVADINRFDGIYKL